MLYGLKAFGQYHFFKTEQERADFIKTLPEVEAKHAECWTTILPAKKVSA